MGYSSHICELLDVFPDWRCFLTSFICLKKIYVRKKCFSAHEGYHVLAWLRIVGQVVHDCSMESREVEGIFECWQAVGAHIKQSASLHPPKVSVWLWGWQGVGVNNTLDARRRRHGDAQPPSASVFPLFTFSMHVFVLSRLSDAWWCLLLAGRFSVFHVFFCLFAQISKWAIFKKVRRRLGAPKFGVPQQNLVFEEDSGCSEMKFLGSTCRKVWN